MLLLGKGAELQAEIVVPEAAKCVQLVVQLQRLELRA